MTDEATASPMADGPAGWSPDARYPEYLMPFAGSLDRHYERFCELREDFLLGYGYNTARAYWGDLDAIYLWAAEREMDVLALSERELRQYLGLLRRRKYSESTVRRRAGTYVRFRRAAGAREGVDVASST